MAQERIVKIVLIKVGQERKVRTHRGLLVSACSDGVMREHDNHPHLLWDVCDELLESRKLRS
jgi:hypothetical protein